MTHGGGGHRPRRRNMNDERRDVEADPLPPVRDRNELLPQLDAVLELAVVFSLVVVAERGRRLRASILRIR
jgi:hypothetical protein